MNLKGYIYGIVSAAFYGLIPLFVLPLKQAGYSVNTTLFYRFLISALCLLGYLIYKRISIRIKGAEMGFLACLGLFYAASTDSLMLGYEKISPGIASAILYAFPIIVAVVMSVFFKEKLTVSTLVSLVITSAGIIILGLKEGTFEINAVGIGVSLLAAFLYAFYLIGVNRMPLKINAMALTFYSLLFSSVYFLGKVALWHHSLAIPSWFVFGNIMGFVFIPTLLSIITLVLAIKLIGPTPTAILGAFEPIVAVLVSVFLFGERATSSLFAGIVCIIIGVAISVLGSSAKQRKQRHQSVQQFHES